MTSFMLILLSGFLRPFLVIEKENRGFYNDMTISEKEISCFLI
jgi:hypothetical protein